MARRWHARRMPLAPCGRPGLANPKGGLDMASTAHTDTT
jgi:hypothetical protein